MSGTCQKLHQKNRPYFTRVDDATCYYADTSIGNQKKCITFADWNGVAQKSHTRSFPLFMLSNQCWAA